MAFDGNGNYSLPTNSFAQPVNDTTIDSDDASTTLEDIATALTKCITKDGQSTTSAAIDFANGIKLGGALVTSTADELNILDGVTASTAELNQLDGVTVGGVAAGDIATIDGTLTLGTLVDTSAGGTEAAFTSIPAWVKKITISLSEVSADASGNFQVQIGDSGGYETTNYGCNLATLVDATAVAVVASTSGFLATRSVVAAANIRGTVTLSLLDHATYLWVATTSTYNNNTGEVFTGGGHKALSGILDRLRVYADGNTYDAGSINILYEG